MPRPQTPVHRQPTDRALHPVTKSLRRLTAPLLACFFAMLAPLPAADFVIDIEYCREDDSPFEVDNEFGTTLVGIFVDAATTWERYLVAHPMAHDVDICVSWNLDAEFSPSTLANTLPRGLDTFDIDVHPNPSGAPWYVDNTPFFGNEFNFSGVGVGNPGNNFVGQTLYRDLTSEQQNLWFNGNPPPVLEVGFRGTAADASGSNPWPDPITGMPSPAFGKIDLFSVALHELGHALGVNSDPLEETWDPAPYQVGGAVMEIEPVVGDSGHIRAQSAMMWTGTPAGMRIMPSAIDILAVDADEPFITGVNLPRKDFVGGGNWHTFLGLGWIGGRVPDGADDVFVRHGGTVSLGDDASAKSLLISTGNSHVRTENHKLEVGGLTQVFTELSVNAGGQAESSDLNLMGVGKLHMDGGLTTVHGQLNVSAIAARIDGHGNVRVGERLVNNGTISADGGILLFTSIGASQDVLDLDGNSTSGVVHADNGDLYFAAALTDEFDGQMRIGAGREITMTKEWTLGPNGSAVFDAGPGAQSPATLDALNTIVKGRILVDGPAVMDSNVIFTPLKGENDYRVQLASSQSRLRLDGFTIYQGGKYAGDGVLDQRGNVQVDHPVEGERFTTIDVKTYDWDGSNDEGSPSITEILPDNVFTINSEVIDEFGDGYDGRVFVEGGDLAIFTKVLDEDSGAFVPAPWKLDTGGQMHLRNSKFWNETAAGSGAVVRGAPIDISGRVFAKGEDNAIMSAVVFRASAQVEVAEVDDELFLNGPVEYHGGSYTGAGTLHQFGDAVFQLDTTIQPKVYDWDGLEFARSTTTIGPGRTVWLRPESIDTGGESGGFGGLAQIHKGTLIVNTHVHQPMVLAFLPWTLDEIGTIDLLGEAVVSGTNDPNILNHPNGSRMIAAGQINASGADNIIYSPTTFLPTARVNVNTGSSLILAGPTRYEGGSYMGDGTLVQNGDALVAAPTTINTRTFDFDGRFEATQWTLASDLTLNVDRLDVANNVFDGTIFADTDSSLTVNLGAASGVLGWEMHGNLAVGISSAAVAELHVDGVPVKLAGTVVVGTGSTLVFDADVCGSVQFNGGGTVVFNGANSPGCSPGVQEFDGNVEFGPSARLNIELASTRPEDYDRLLVSGQATLDGTLRVETLGRFVPTPGDRFAVMTYGRGRGAFDRFEASGAADGLMFVPDYDNGELTLAYTVLGDVNASSRVDRTDAAILFAHFGMTKGATPDLGDLDGDGSVGLIDLALLQANFRRSIAASPTASQAAVPEPSSLVLSLLAMIGLGIVGRRRRAL